jgi:hypothetical protein
VAEPNLEGIRWIKHVPLHRSRGQALPGINGEVH